MKSGLFRVPFVGVAMLCDTCMPTQSVTEMAIDGSLFLCYTDSRCSY